MAAGREPHGSLYDTIVVGAGIQGSFAAYHLAKRGQETLLLEQFPLPHSRGSSHGQSRIIRRAYPQEHYALMMAESYQLWERLEAEAGTRLYRQTGMLVLGADTDPEFQRYCQSLERHGVPGERLTPEALCGRFPGIRPHGGEAAVSDGTAGILHADRALRAVQRQLQAGNFLLHPLPVGPYVAGLMPVPAPAELSPQDAFRRCGGALRDGHKVTDIKPGVVVTVTTSGGVYRAKSLVITAGPWTNQLLAPLGLQLPLQVLPSREGLADQCAAPRRCASTSATGRRRSPGRTVSPRTSPASWPCAPARPSTTSSGCPPASTPAW
ncbi:peroxisomal sarcosine oxidase isoform X4 [Pelodiscus sinensis]|uniref:peroxisomal sarcosine oxidase isoform X4 n=1 Tax=Pelodiscus sinensis TaxID=13735 RepID=UPI003F6BC906